MTSRYILLSPPLLPCLSFLHIYDQVLVPVLQRACHLEFVRLPFPSLALVRRAYETAPSEALVSPSSGGSSALVGPF
jgi:hypothetical protein